MNKISLLLALVIIFIGVTNQAHGANSQTNVSGSNTSIEGGYTGGATTYESGSSSNTTTNSTSNSNILDTDHSEIPHEHKCAHILALENGNYAAQPNNRLIWDIPSFTVKDEIPDWKVQTSEWNVEDTRKWKTEDTDRFFYEIEEKKHD